MKTIEFVTIYDKNEQNKTILAAAMNKNVEELDSVRERLISVFKQRYKQDVRVSFIYTENAL